MRKILLFFLLCILVVLLLGYSKMINKGVPLKHFPENSSLRKALELPEDHVINHIILLPHTEFSQTEAASIITRIGELPYQLLEEVNNKHIRIRLFTGKLTDNPTANHLKGVVPKGYRSTKTWDDVPGIGGGKIVLVKIGCSERGMGHSAINLELHELAHSIDRHVFDNLRERPEFLKVWNAERYSLFPGSAYLQTYPEEYFAEAFAMYYYSSASRQELRQKAPKTYQYINSLN